jgi:hypothetical protein
MILMDKYRIQALNLGLDFINPNDFVSLQHKAW